MAGYRAPSAPARVPSSGSAWARSRRAAPTALAITAAGGRYELDGLAAGRYQVEFTAGCGDTRYAARWYQGATTRRGARPVTVTAGSVTTGIDQG